MRVDLGCEGRREASRQRWIRRALQERETEKMSREFKLIQIYKNEKRFQYPVDNQVKFINSQGRCASVTEATRYAEGKMGGWMFQEGQTTVNNNSLTISFFRPCWRQPRTLNPIALGKEMRSQSHHCGKHPYGDAAWQVLQQVPWPNLLKTRLVWHGKLRLNCPNFLPFPVNL